MTQCFIYPSGDVACGAFMIPDLITTLREQVTCGECKVAMREQSEFCERCHAPAGFIAAWMPHTCDPCPPSQEWQNAFVRPRS